MVSFNELIIDGGVSDDDDDILSIFCLIFIVWLVTLLWAIHDGTFTVHVLIIYFWSFVVAVMVDVIVVLNLFIYLLFYFFNAPI